MATFETYHALLTLTENNMRVIHWKLKGDDFDVVHPRYASYYEKLGEMMDEIHIIPASYDVRDTVGYGGTCVYMKSGKKLAELIEVLRTGDSIRKKKMTVYGVTNCGMESERVYRGLDELTEAKGYLTIVIVKYS